MKIFRMLICLLRGHDKKTPKGGPNDPPRLVCKRCGCKWVKVMFDDDTRWGYRWKIEL